jgi:hypothetical protein
MFYVEIFLLLNFTALCAILVVLWQIRDHLVQRAQLPGAAAPAATDRRDAK